MPRPSIIPNTRLTFLPLHSLFDMNTQALDHMFVSRALEGKAQYEHIHVNTWAQTEVSDHDPSVAMLNVCGC